VRLQSYQHVYLALLYGLLAIKSVLVDDFTALAEGVIGSVRIKPLTRGEAAVLWGGKALYTAWFLALPALYSRHSWGALAVLWLTAEAVAGWTLAFMFQVLHPRRRPADLSAVILLGYLTTLWQRLTSSMGILCLNRRHVPCLTFANTTLLELELDVRVRRPQVAHVVGDVEFLQADQKTGKVPRGWAAAQVATSADFAHGSWFWTHFSGGLNYQVRRLTY